MEYLLKASAILFMFYACYQLFLQKETFFQANRWFLLSGLIIACLIPLVVIPVYIEYTVTNTSNFIINTESTIPNVIHEEQLDYTQLIIWTYFAGVLFFFGKLCSEFLSLKNVLNTSKSRPFGQYKLLETNRNIAPFSFLNCIVYNPKQFGNEELTHIINHEKVHCKELHSLDTIIAQISCILFWFNPIAWLYKKALQQNLEFIADRKAQHVSFCEKSYQTVLLKASVKNHQLAITNNFYTSLIKKRIIMLHKSKSSKINLLKMAFVIPLLVLFMMSFNVKDVYVEIQSEDIEQKFNKDMSDHDLAQIKKELADQGVTFKYSGIKRNEKGEITAIKTEWEHEGNSRNYNAKSDNAIEPFIFISKNGSIGIGTFTDKTSKTLLTNTGKTKTQSTGSNSFSYKQKDTLFIQKQNNKLIKERDTILINRNSKNQTWISKDGTKTNINASENGNSYVFTTQSEDPLFVVNGKIVTKYIFEDVDSDKIESINVLKDNVAIERFGDRGKNGVILLRTKGSPKWVIGDTVKVETFETDQSKDSIIHKSYKKGSNDVTYNFTSRTYQKDEPLYIIDDNIATYTEFKLINTNNIESMEVLKDKSAVKTYGDKGKNGVIIITTKTTTNGGKPVIIEIEENSPWEIKTQVSSVVYEGGNKKATVEYIISKNSTDSFLEKQKRDLKNHGIDAKFSKVRRNKAGEITSIKISLDDNNGRKSSASWKEKDQAIPDIVMGKSKNDKLFVRAIGH